MLVLVVLAESRSPVGWPNGENVPLVISAPLIETVALARLRLSVSKTETLPDRVAGVACSSVQAVSVATLESTGGSLIGVMLTVVVATVLRLLEPWPSLSIQVTVRVGSEPESVGFSLDAKGTARRT